MEKLKILAVDDNSVNLAALEKALKDKYDVTLMISGRRAVRYVAIEKVDLILLDIEMPMMDGVETLKEIRALPNGAEVPVMFLTASKDKTHIIEGSKLGIIDYITKPFDMNDLLHRIQSAFQRFGLVTVDPKELLEIVQEAYEAIDGAQERVAFAKCEEIACLDLNAQEKDLIDGAISGLLTGDRVLALNMISNLKNYIKGIVDAEEAEKREAAEKEFRRIIMQVLIQIKMGNVQKAIQLIDQMPKSIIPPQRKPMLSAIYKQLKANNIDIANTMLNNMVQNFN